MNREMMLDAMRKMGPPPPKIEIQVGDMDEFKAALKRNGNEVVDGEVPTFFGIPVRFNPNCPPNKAVMFEDGKVARIITLSADE